MFFWWFMFFNVLLIPAIMVIGGYMMWKHYPKQINSVVGYRTRWSRINMDTWKFTHEYCGKLWWYLGWILLALSAVSFLPFLHASTDTIGIAATVIMSVQLALLLLSIVPTERALRQTFNPDGSRK